MRLWISMLLLAALAAAAPPPPSDLDDELLAATRKSDVAKVKELLDKGANVNAKTRYNQTPLFFACDRGSIELIQLLIDRGADVNAKDNFYNATPMTWAMMKKNKDVIRLLVEKGIDPSDALNQSIQSNDKDLFAFILAKGKTTPVILSDAMQLAETAKRAEMIEQLKAKGAKVINFEVDAATLESYVGTYSDGAMTTIAVTVKDGKLVFSQQGFTSSINAVAKDTFRLVAAGLTIEFQRDANAKVTAMLLPGRGGNTVLKRQEGK